LFGRGKFCTRVNTDARRGTYRGGPFCSGRPFPTSRQRRRRRATNPTAISSNAGI
jgi:hypothetical protein